MSTMNPMMGASQGGNPMGGVANAGGQSSNPYTLAGGYGWQPQNLNWGGIYGPMQWPSWNQLSMNAQGLYGALFNPFLMMGGQGQQGGAGGGSQVPNQQTAAPGAGTPTSLASPHFAYQATAGTPTVMHHNSWPGRIWRGPEFSSPYVSPETTG